MKGFLKTIIGLILILVFLGIITFKIDNARISIGKTPVASILVFSHKDGGTKEYFGIGYKIIAYNKENGYKKYHIGTYRLAYDGTLGEEGELAELSKQNVEEMGRQKSKDTVVFTNKAITNKDKFLIFIDVVASKDEKRHELKFTTKTKEGRDINHNLMYENNQMFYSIDRSFDEEMNNQAEEAIVTYEVEAFIKEKLSEDNKTVSFYVINKLTNEEVLLVNVPYENLKLQGE